MNRDIILIIVGYLQVKHRLVCKEWSKLIPYNINKLENILSKSSNDIFEEVKDYTILRKFIKLLHRTNRLNFGICCVDCKEFGEIYECLVKSSVCYRCLDTHRCITSCKFCDSEITCKELTTCDECEISLCYECYDDCRCYNK